jgi:hypothetical protein
MSAWSLTLLIGATLHHGRDNGIKAHAGVSLTDPGPGPEAFALSRNQVVGSSSSRPWGPEHLFDTLGE